MWVGGRDDSRDARYPLGWFSNVSPEMLDGHSSESNMVRNIADVIERKCEQGRFPAPVQHLFDNNDSFFSARNSLGAYIKNSNLYLPTCIKVGEPAKGISSIPAIVPASSLNRFTYASNSEVPINNTNRYTL